jgi:SAM-dependent methyltransferase
MTSNKTNHFAFRYHPEKCIDGFTALDGTIRFFGFVKAILLKTGARDVLDFGAGRGGFWHDDPSSYRRQMRDLRTTGAAVTACDIDEAVLSHPCSDTQVVIFPGKRLPFADEGFDVIVSDMTFEHIEQGAFVARELLRILRKGGFICARTTNRFGYVRVMTALVPKRLHAPLLRAVQPNRKAEDVFPTVYNMNSPSQVRRLFAGCNVYHFYDSAEPAYYFGNRVLYSMSMLAHKLLPSRLATTVCLFIEKAPGSA